MERLATQEASFSLTDIPGFPYDEYNSNLTRYSELETWYDGSALDETVQRAGKEIDLYPVKINPIDGMVEKHAHFLFGQVSQDDRPLVRPRIQSSYARADVVEEVLARAWMENHGRAIQWENGTASQIYGGCVFHVVYDPFSKYRTVPIRIEAPHPKSFVGIPSSTDFWRLKEAWILTPLSPMEALGYGVDVGPDGEAWLIEHYTDQLYEVTVNGVEAIRTIDGVQSKIGPIGGVNPWGFVPVVYIPHTRAKKFYGTSAITGTEGIVKELNLRVADFGDAVTVDAHNYLGMRNVNGAPTVMQIAPGMYAVNLGSIPSITGHEQEPDLFQLRQQTASTAMADLVKQLYIFFRRQGKIPAVVDGEDEGSQRSGMTLVTRMVGLTSHTDAERIFWTTGLTLLNSMILRILAMVGESGITIKDATAGIKMEWAPVLPRDRETIVNEAVTLISSKLGSPERLLELLGVDNIEEEKKLIMDFWEEISEYGGNMSQPGGQARSPKEAQDGQKKKEETL